MRWHVADLPGAPVDGFLSHCAMLETFFLYRAMFSRESLLRSVVPGEHALHLNFMMSQFEEDLRVGEYRDDYRKYTLFLCKNLFYKNTEAEI